MYYPEIYLRWDFDCDEKTLNIVERILDDINDVYSQIGRLNNNDISAHAIYKLIEIDLYFHLVTLRNIHFLYRLSKGDLTEPCFPEFPSDVILYKVLYSSLERWDVFLTLLKFHWNNSSGVCPRLLRWKTKMLYLGKRFYAERPNDSSRDLKTLEAIVNDMQRTLRINRIRFTPAIALTARETPGLCVSFLERFPTNSYAYIIQLDPDSYNYIISSAHDPETRKKVFLTYYRETDETIFVEKLLKAEKDYAKQLGYRNSSEMFFSNNFLQVSPMLKIYKHLAHRISSTLNRKRKLWLKQKQRQCTRFGYKFNEELELYDIDYCQETSTVVSYCKLSHLLADYFPLGHVVVKLLSMYEHLFGLKVSPVFDFPAWHEDVQAFSVRDAESGNEQLGYILLDLLSRKEKIDEPTYCYVLQPGLNPLFQANSREIAVVAVVSSFKESLEYSKKTTRTLLSHKELEGLCRGLGSAFQGVCSSPAYTSYNTVVMENDILGVVGKFWNNFAWEPEILRCISCHYMSGKPITDELIENLVNVRYDKDLFKTAVSVYNGIIDLKIRQGSKDLNITKETLYKYIFGLKFSKYLDFTVDNLSVTSLPFPRLYYYDLWCQIVSDDLFYSRFKVSSVINPKIGFEFRKKILEPFGTVSPHLMFKSFLGRKPNEETFLKVRNL